MNSITVSKADLIQKLKSNREKHVLEYEAAVDGWRLAADEALTEAVRAWKAGEDDSLQRIYKVRMDHVKPVSSAAEYTRALEMLSWEQADSIELSEEDFQHFVQDDWDWTHNFKVSTSRYTTS